jgi:hypothetical protein
VPCQRPRHNTVERLAAEVERQMPCAPARSRAAVPAWRAQRSSTGSVDAPMAGMEASELGRCDGEHGILKYIEPQTIAIERGLPVGAPPWIAQTITHAS